MMQTILISALLAIATVSAFRAPPMRQTTTNTHRMTTLPMDHFSSLVNAVAEAKPDDYVYGAVAAPEWVLPLGLS